MDQSNDEHFARLAASAASLENHFPLSEDEWSNSPFKWIRKRKSRTIGAIIEALVEGWLVSNGMNVKRSGDDQADRVVEGIRVEIKGSTLWGNGTYKFQQIRDQNYEWLICLGISPHDAHCWVLPKQKAMTLWENGILRTQHGGRSGTDTCWFTVNPHSPQDWLTPQGGELSNAIHIIRDFARR